MSPHLKNRELHLRALKVALVVGTILCIINHGDNLLTNSMTTTHWLKLVATYFVPYAVSLYSAVNALKSKS